MLARRPRAGVARPGAARGRACEPQQRARGCLRSAGAAQSRAVCASSRCAFPLPGGRARRCRARAGRALVGRTPVGSAGAVAVEPGAPRRSGCRGVGRRRSLWISRGHRHGLLHGCGCDRREEERAGDNYISYYDNVLASDLEAAGTWELVQHEPLPGESPARLVLFRSGWGDGSYPCYWGCRADGTPVVLVIDFMVIEGGDARRDDQK